MAAPAWPWEFSDPPTLPCFSGELQGDPVATFCEEAERVLHGVHFPDAMGVEWLLQHLEGLARREVLNQPASDRATPAAVLAILRRTFRDHRPLAALLTAFHGRQQRPGEALGTFARDLMGLAKTVNARSEGSLSTTMVRDHFVEGLSDLKLKRELRRTLRADQNITLTALRVEAEEWLCDDGIQGDDQTTVAVRHQQAAARPDPGVDLPVTSVGRVEHHPKECGGETQSRATTALMERVEKVELQLQALINQIATLEQAAASAGPRRKRKRRPHFRAWTAEGRPVCFRCHKPGHLRFGCTKKTGVAGVVALVPKPPSVAADKVSRRADAKLIPVPQAQPVAPRVPLQPPSSLHPQPPVPPPRKRGPKQRKMRRGASPGRPQWN